MIGDLQDVEEGAAGLHHVEDVWANMSAEFNGSETSGANTTDFCLVEIVSQTFVRRKGDVLNETQDLIEAEEEDGEMADGTVLGLIYLLVGLMFLFYGKKFFKTMCFFLGFLSAAGARPFAGRKAT